MIRLAATRTSASVHHYPFRRRFPRQHLRILKIARWVLRVPRTKPRRTVVRAPIRRVSPTSSGGSDPHLELRAV
jgi:hypothetical protein